MNLDYFRKLTSLNLEAFTGLGRHLGMAAAAIYRLQGDHWEMILGYSESEEASTWPAIITDGFYYTSAGTELPHGYWRLPPKARIDDKKFNLFYFPEQLFCDVKICFGFVLDKGVKRKTGTVDGSWESIANRMRTWVAEQDGHNKVSEQTFHRVLETLGADLHQLVDHELRTPLASVSGYTKLLTDMVADGEAESLKEYVQIIDQQMNQAVAALEKLSITMANQKGEAKPLEVKLVDCVAAVTSMKGQMEDQMTEFVSADIAERTKIRFHSAIDGAALIEADPRLFKWATWEVIKNAVIHSRTGKVDIEIYRTDNMLVVDIADDGDGVAEGAEELVFLRFFQDPTTRFAKRGKRGLGLGLYLARQIARQHLGQLIYIRKAGRAGHFRFLWPAISGQSHLDSA